MSLNQDLREYKWGLLLEQWLLSREGCLKNREERPLPIEGLYTHDFNQDFYLNIG